MPITLTTPFSWDAGHNAGAMSLAQVKIVRCAWGDMPRIDLLLEYGDTVNGAWAGETETRKTIRFEGAPYDDLVANAVTKAGEGHNVFLGAKRSLYKQLISDGYYAGTIV